MSGTLVCRKLLDFYLFTPYKGSGLLRGCILDDSTVLVFQPLLYVMEKTQECRSPWFDFYSFLPPFNGCALKLNKVRVDINGKVYLFETKK